MCKFLDNFTTDIKLGLTVCRLLPVALKGIVLNFLELESVACLKTLTLGIVLSFQRVVGAEQSTHVCKLH